MYHGLTDQRADPPYWCHIPTHEFDEHMRALAAGYRVLPLAEVIKAIRTGQTLPDSVACVTFDDGFRTIATRALPILERERIPATVFVVTSLVGSRQPAWPDALLFSVDRTHAPAAEFEGMHFPLDDARARRAAYSRFCARLKEMHDAERRKALDRLYEQLGAPKVEQESPFATLDWEEIRSLRASGLVDIGSHTHSHPMLSRCPEEVQRYELSRSRAVLQANGIPTADLLAYPNGDYSAQTLRIAADEGYASGLTTVPGLAGSGRDTMALPRVLVGPGVSGEQLAMSLTGLVAGMSC